MYARHREALSEWMHQWRGLDGKVMAVSRKGTRGERDEGGMGVGRQSGSVLRERER